MQKQQTPKGVELAADELILHVEGTASSQRVVRHIGGASRPGSSNNFRLLNTVLGWACEMLSLELTVKVFLSR